MTRGSESTTRLKRSPEALWREGSFGVVVLAPRASEPVTLAGTGSALWHAFDRERTIDEAATLLAVEFDTDPERVAGDLEPVLTTLLESGALEETS